jgi:transposase
MLFNFSTPLWLYPKPADFRKQIDGLVLLVADHLALDPTSGQLFIFRNRTANKIKMLWWDKNGFWLLYKRLEKGGFKFPGIQDAVMEIETEQLSWLLSGLDFTLFKPLPTVEAKHFY